MNRHILRLPAFAFALFSVALLLGNPGCGARPEVAPGTGLVDQELPEPGHDLLECPPIDIVFIMDTSSSMEDEAAALCSAISQVEAELVSRGAVVANVSLLGIDADAADLPADFACLTGNVVDAYGAEVPGTPSNGDVVSIQNDEDWGPAMAIVAANHPWSPGALRLIVPISDESPSKGNPCRIPGDDQDTVTHAIIIANENNVIISPIAGTGTDACEFSLMIALAQGTGGTDFRSTDPVNELSGFVLQLIENACLGSNVDTCPGEQLRVLDDRGSLDDQFDVYLDGELLFRTPLAGGRAPCINSIPSGRHTLRIVFALDKDDPDGSDRGENGDFGIILLNGVDFEDGPGVRATDTTVSAEDLWPQGTYREYTIDVP